MSYFLKILVSPDKRLEGAKIDLHEGENLAGRAKPPSEIELDGTKVSKKHCVFTLQGLDLKVDDLKSSNGLFVNGKKVLGSPLRDKDRIVIGEFVLEVGSSAPSGPPKAGTKP